MNLVLKFFQATALSLCLFSFSALADSNSDLAQGVINNNPDLVQQALTAGADANAMEPGDGNPRSLLSVAARNGNFNIVSLLVSAGADVNKKDQLLAQAINFAVWAENQQVVEFLLSKGAQINNRCLRSYMETPLIASIEKKNSALVRLLISKGADVNQPASQGVRPLHLATRSKLIDVMEMVLAAGADPVSLDRANGYSPMFYAARVNCNTCVDLLVKYKADPNQLSGEEYGLTPLILAADKGSVDAAQSLIKNGALVNRSMTMNRGGSKSALNISVMNENIPMANLLLQNGALVNHAVSSGRTSISLAAALGNESLVNLLLKNNADTCRRDQNLKSASDYARENHFDNISDLLEKQTCKDDSAKNIEILRSLTGCYLATQWEGEPISNPENKKSTIQFENWGLSEKGQKIAGINVSWFTGKAPWPFPGDGVAKTINISQDVYTEGNYIRIESWAQNYHADGSKGWQIQQRSSFNRMANGELEFSYSEKIGSMTMGSNVILIPTTCNSL